MSCLVISLTTFSQNFFLLSHVELLPTMQKLDVFLALKGRKRRAGGEILGFSFDFTPPVAGQLAGVSSSPDTLLGQLGEAD